MIQHNLMCRQMLLYSHAIVALRSLSVFIYCYVAQGVLPCKGLWETTSQLDQPSLPPLSEADCGLLQLGLAHCATSVALLQIVDN